MPKIAPYTPRAPHIPQFSLEELPLATAKRAQTLI